MIFRGAGGPISGVLRIFQARDIGNYRTDRYQTTGLASLKCLVWNFFFPVIPCEQNYIPHHILGSPSKGGTFSINHTGISRGNKFELVQEYANRLSPGTATLNITRKRTLIVQAEEVLKLLNIEFYPKPLTFEVKD